MLDGWYVRDNAFTKGFMDYVVEVKRVNTNVYKGTFIPYGEKSINIKVSDLPKPKVAVTIWKGNGYEDTKHTETFDNFEDAFKFVEEFSKQKFFDQVVEEYFKCESKSS